MKNPTEQQKEHIFFTLVVGYFACAQYDMRGFIRYCATFLYCHCCGAVRLDLNQSVRYSGVSEAEKYIFVFPSFFAE